MTALASLPQHPFIRPEDHALAAMLPGMHTADLDLSTLKFSPAITTLPVHLPDDFGFLHEAAIIEFHGTLYAAWYNNKQDELQGYTPIRGRRSTDGGKSWTPVETIAHDPQKKLLYCPPVFGICDDKLYMLLNTMVAPDHMHSLDLYVLDESTDQFTFLWSRPLPFKLNTNVVQLPNGKLLLPGRIAKLDDFPATPAVLISDNGKIDAPWRLVKIQDDMYLPDGEKLVHPELSAVVTGNDLYIFCRDDLRRVPLIYHSPDLGEHWDNRPYFHDLPFTASKIYSGTLADGRNYVVGNIAKLTTDVNTSSWDRNTMALFLAPAGSMEFNQGYLLRDGDDPILKLHPQWSYPAACEANGKLYIIYSAVQRTESPQTRGAILSIVDLKQL